MGFIVVWLSAQVVATSVEHAIGWLLGWSGIPQGRHPSVIPSLAMWVIVVHPGTASGALAASLIAPGPGKWRMLVPIVVLSQLFAENTHIACILESLPGPDAGHLDGTMAYAGAHLLLAISAAAARPAAALAAWLGMLLGTAL